MQLKTRIQALLKNELADFSLDDAFLQRSTADKIEDDCRKIVKSHFKDSYKPARSKRSLEDFLIVENGTKNWIDVKTHFAQLEVGFSMPNLVSIDRLRKTLNKPNEEIVYVFVSYTRTDKVYIKDVEVRYVYELDWSVLQIGNLGKGQLQIRDANKPLVYTIEGKESWMNRLKQEAISFYEKRIKAVEKELNTWKQ